MAAVGILVGRRDMTVSIRVGDAREALRDLPDGSVHCVVTSPPYWGLRAYKGDPGMIGMEPTFDEHLENLVSVFREVRRVLRDDGTLWLNYGDAYAAARGGTHMPAETLAGGVGGYTEDGERTNRNRDDGYSPRRDAQRMGYKHKDLMMMPARVALALQADGWWLRSEVVWHKPNPMPESVTDRPTSAHEKLYLLTPSARYFYDAEAVRTEEVLPGDSDRRKRRQKWDNKSAPDRGQPTKAGIRPLSPDEDYEGVAPGASRRPPKGGQAEWDATGVTGANLRNVWRIPTAPYKDAHFATFPPALVEPCIKAGTSEKGVCAGCGAPWKREVDTPRIPDEVRNRRKDQKMGFHPRQVGSGTKMNKWRNENPPTTTGWLPTCECNAETVPAVVLDCFGGAGTVGLVADRLQRDSVLIEISDEYAAMACKRITADAPMLASVTLEGDET